MLLSWALALLAAGNATSPADALVLARDGETALAIVVADGASPAERTASVELATYLERATSASFPVLSEADHAEPAPAIWVGPTVAAARMGIDAASLGPEQWRIRTGPGSLVLVGGRPRGTLYAVYRFLEDYVGVRWWTPYEETVPHRPDLAIPPIDGTGEPAFVYRDLHGVDGPPIFHAHNRANGHYSFLPRALGGNEGYGPPFMVHDFYHYVPPEEYFDEHPELFSEIDGRRTADKAQLCLTNEDLLEIVTQKMKGYIEQARAEAREHGEDPPRLFAFSHNDWGRPCDCQPCTRLADAEGSRSAPLVRFVNRLADNIADDYPDVLIDTLAYDFTFEAPRTLTLRDNVVLRVSALQRRDFLRPVTHRVHRGIRRSIEAWRGKTRHLRIWDYTVTFGFEANNLPLPNLHVVADDFRYYRDHGVEGLFIQHDHPVAGDMRDLKLWVVFKLAEDPSREVDALIAEFTHGFYGPAAETIREYLARLERKAARRGTAIRFPTDYTQFGYLDAKFLRWAQDRFDRAEALVADDPLLARRVRHARLSLDRATLWRWSDALETPARRRRRPPALDPDVVLERYRETAAERIESLVSGRRREERRQWLERELWELQRRLDGRDAATGAGEP